MNDQLTGVTLGLLGGSVITAAAWLFLDGGFLLLSALGVVWFGAIAVVYPQRRLLTLFGTRSRRDTILTILLLYVVAALQRGVSLSPERALVVALIAIGLLVVGIGLGSIQTAEQL